MLALPPAFEPPARPPDSLSVTAAAATGGLSIGLFLAGLPLVSLAVLASAGVYALIAKSRRRPDPAVLPEDIVSFDAQETYRCILLALADVERALAAAPHLDAMAQPLLERCRTAVALSGRIATLGNPIQRYLDLHDPAYVRFELDKLHARRGATSDVVTIGALDHAAAARKRQLAVHDELVAARDRIQARLELVRAGLESFAAVVVKLEVANDEAIELVEQSVDEQLDGIGEDLQVVESALIAA